jgi:predicted TIM-barrel fold metal-dependent hydrolase
LRETITRVLRSYGLSSRGTLAGATAFADKPDERQFTDADLDVGAFDRDDWHDLGAAGMRRVVVRRLPATDIPLSPDDSDLPALRAVINPPPDADRHTLQALHDRGVRGLRFVLDRRRDPYSILACAERVVSLGWHIEVELPDGRSAQPLGDAEWVLMQLPVPTCFSGLAGFLAHRDTDDAEAAFLLELVQMGRFWLKLSGAEIATARVSTRDALRRLVHAAMAVRDDRLVWGSGSSSASGEMRARVDAALQTLREWLPDDVKQSRVLWSNPAALYRF